MYLKEVSEQLDGLYSTKDSYNGTNIYPDIFWDGDGMGFLFSLEEDKYARIEVSSNFGEWIACCTGDWKKATPTIRRLAKPYNVEWDEERGILFIRFRRNEMTVGQAVSRLKQAVLVVGSLGKYIKIE